MNIGLTSWCVLQKIRCGSGSRVGSAIGRGGGGRERRKRITKKGA